MYVYVRVCICMDMCICIHGKSSLMISVIPSQLATHQFTQQYSNTFIVFYYLLLTVCTATSVKLNLMMNESDIYRT
jgi:hypothetical protein